MPLVRRRLRSGLSAQVRGGEDAFGFFIRRMGLC